ncbi:putative alpha-12-galactosyltransferase C8D2.17, partial [Dissostichus eleginoides]
DLPAPPLQAPINGSVLFWFPSRTPSLAPCVLESEGQALPLGWLWLLIFTAKQRSKRGWRIPPPIEFMLNRRVNPEQRVQQKDVLLLNSPLYGIASLCFNEEAIDG